MSTGVCQCLACGGVYDDETDCKCAAKGPDEMLPEYDFSKMKRVQGPYERYAEHLKAENKRLRDALLKIASDTSPAWDPQDNRRLASEALKTD